VVGAAGIDVVVGSGGGMVLDVGRVRTVLKPVVVVGAAEVGTLGVVGVVVGALPPPLFGDGHWQPDRALVTELGHGI